MEQIVFTDEFQKLLRNKKHQKHSLWTEVAMVEPSVGSVSGCESAGDGTKFRLLVRVICRQVFDSCIKYRFFSDDSNVFSTYLEANRKYHNVRMLLRKIILSLLAMISVETTIAQAGPAADLKPYGVAVVVRNVETSSEWYQSVFKLRSRNRNDNEERGSKIAVLTNADLLVELIEKKSSLTQKSILADNPNQTLIQGFTKVSFRTSDFDKLIPHMKELGVRFFGDVYTDPVSNQRSFIILDPDDNLIQIFE